MADWNVIGVIGAGTMGRGIVQLMAQAGRQVVLFDAAGGAASDGRDFVAGMIDRAVAKGRMSADEAQAIMARITVAYGMADLARCGVVIEAVVENLEVKRSVVAGLDAILAPEAIIASNTSSLSITAIAAGSARPERVAGLHFFNPVPLMRVVEVVRAVDTAPEVADRLMDLVATTGHVPVLTGDTPGFLVNHCGRGLYTEGLRVVQEAVADPATVDLVLTGALGFRMGPFELLDLTGLDVSFEVMKKIYGQFWNEPRFRPTPLPALQVEAGLFGRKTGRGFYRYTEGQIQRPAEPALPDLPADAPTRLWLDPSDLSDPGFMAALAERLGAVLDTGAQPAGDSVIVLAPLGHDASAASLLSGHDPARVVLLDPLCPPSGRMVLMASPAVAPGVVGAARHMLAAAGLTVTAIKDSPGFIAQRVLATIVNIAAEVAQQAIASPGDIDRAVNLGLGYPQGPLAWGDRIGAGTILTILDRIHARTGDPRYRASLWLRRRAELGLSLHTA